MIFLFGEMIKNVIKHCLLRAIGLFLPHVCPHPLFQIFFKMGIFVFLQCYQVGQPGLFGMTDIRK